MIELKKGINRKKIPKTENPNIVVNIVEKILIFNKQQNGKELQRMLACVATVSDRSRSPDFHHKHINQTNYKNSASSKRNY